MNLKKLKKALYQRGSKASFVRAAVAVSALSLAWGPLYAQKGFDFGLRGVVQTTSLINSTDQAAGPELDYQNYTTMAFGVEAGYSFTNHLGVELNILSSRQGQGYKGDPTKVNANSGAIMSSYLLGLASVDNIPVTGNYTGRITTQCIKIPVLFRYTGNSTKKVFFSSFIGPQINLLSSVKFKVNDKEAPFTGFGFKPEDLYKKTTMDVAFGFGAGFNLSDNLVLSAHMRFDYGLGDIENKSYVTPGSTDKAWDPARASTHNATGGLMIGLSYKLVKKEKEQPKKGAAPAKKPAGK